jgi:hypothetical protein
MPVDVPLTTSQLVVRICLFLFTAIALLGGTLQFVLGQPDTTPRLDNVHRFLAGIYFGTGLICLWTAVTVRQQGMLVYLIAVAVFLAGLGRVTSMSIVGLPEPRALWLGYLVPELVLPLVMAATHYFGSQTR